MSGQFIVGQPFDAYIERDTVYTVSSVLDLREIISSDLDPLENIYKANGLSEEEFDYDLENGIGIVSLTTDKKSNNYLYLPMRYIQSAPLLDYRKYQNSALVFSLAALPVDVDLESLKSEINNYIENRIGVESKSKTVLTSEVFGVKHSKSKLIEAKRKTRITRETPFLLNEKYKETISDLNEKIKKLEQYIIDKLDN